MYNLYFCNKERTLDEWTLWHVISKHYFRFDFFIAECTICHVYLLNDRTLALVMCFKVQAVLCLHPKKIKGPQLWSLTDPPIWYIVPPALTEDFKPVTGSVLAQSGLNAPALVQ